MTLHVTFDQSVCMVGLFCKELQSLDLSDTEDMSSLTDSVNKIVAKLKHLHGLLLIRAALIGLTTHQAWWFLVYIAPWEICSP